jgi:hypothetical protein
MPISPPSIFKGGSDENYSTKLKAYLGIYDNSARDYFMKVDENLDVPITDRYI